jgi:archaemetzincin
MAVSLGRMKGLGRRHLLLGLGSTWLGCGADPEPVPRAKSGIEAAAKRGMFEALPPYAPHHLRRVRDALAAETDAAPRPKAGDWLYDHPETGQSFEEYLRSQPTAPEPGKRTLAILPLGELAPTQRKIVALSADYLARHFGLPVRTLDPIALGDVPANARRNKFGSTQLLTRWLLDHVLPPHRPSDATALLAFTGSDLWPGDDWNFVFGEATFDKRVGVWSLFRNGDPDESPAAFTLALERALKTAVHETGHMFSLPHCTRYACVQAGINSLEESDRAPLWLCPECLPKVSWVTSTDPRERLAQPLDFCRAQGLAASAKHFERALALIG